MRIWIVVLIIILFSSLGMAAEEICDGKDNDGDGEIDEGITCLCELYISGSIRWDQRFDPKNSEYNVFGKYPPGDYALEWVEGSIEVGYDPCKRKCWGSNQIDYRHSDDLFVSWPHNTPQNPTNPDPNGPGADRVSASDYLSLQPDVTFTHSKGRIGVVLFDSAWDDNGFYPSSGNGRAYRGPLIRLKGGICGAIEKPCVDTDGGKNVLVKGKTSNDPKADPLVDFCSNGDGSLSVYEYWCDGKFIISDHIPCPAGKVCKDGACIDKECQKDTDCKDGKACINGLCLLCGNLKLDAGEACDDGRHCADRTFCTSDKDCAEVMGEDTLCKLRDNDGCNYECKPECDKVCNVDKFEIRWWYGLQGCANIPAAPNNYVNVRVNNFIQSNMFCCCPPPLPEICNIDSDCEEGEICKDEECVSESDVLDIKASLGIDLEYLKKASNNFIDTTQYEETVEITTELDEIDILIQEYEIATEKDILICNASIKLSGTALPPEDYYVHFEFYKNTPESFVPKKYHSRQNLQKDCIQNSDEIYCFRKADLSKKNIGNIIGCNAWIEKKNNNKYTIITEGASSERFVIAKYIFYFVPLGIETYGVMDKAYSKFLDLSYVNDDIESVGKKIVLKPTGGLGVNKVKGVIERSLGEVYIERKKDTVITGLSTAEINKQHYCKLSRGGNGATSCSFFGKGIQFLNVASKETTLSHELGHAMGYACDEYRLKTWIRQGKSLKEHGYDGCPNPVGPKYMDYPDIRFPICCLKQTGIECEEKNGVCINPNHKELFEGEITAEFDCPDDAVCLIPKYISEEECRNDGGCYINTYTHNCVKCPDGLKCEKIEGTFKTVYRCRCEGTDTSCARRNSRSIVGEKCIDCTVKGGKCNNYRCTYPDQEIKTCEGTDRSCYFNEDTDECMDCTKYSAVCRDDPLSSKGIRCVCAGTDTSCGEYTGIIPDNRNYICQDCTIKGKECRSNFCQFVSTTDLCGTPESCPGMSYTNKEGNNPNDIKSPFGDFHSIMGSSPSRSSGIFPNELLYPLGSVKK